MKRRIAIWAGAGVLVAGCWALFVFATFPHTNQWMHRVWALAVITCPITAVKSVPVSLYEVFVANAATYALVGFLVELLRRQFHPQHQI